MTTEIDYLPILFPLAEDAAPSSDDFLESLLKMRDDFIGVSTLKTEEDMVVGALFQALLQVLRVIPGGIEVSVDVLEGYAGVERLSISSKGELLVMHANGEMEAIQLGGPDRRDLLVDVIEDAFPKVSAQIAEMKEKLEKRIVYLSSVTDEVHELATSMAGIKAKIE